MATATKPLQYLFTAYFDDGINVEQGPDDRYSKHDDDAEWNPSAFRDVLERQKEAELLYFDINDGVFAYGLDLRTWKFGINGTWFSLEDPNEPLTDRKLLYYRVTDREYILDKDGVTEAETRVAAYVLGYEGKTLAGEKKERVIYIHGKQEEPS